LGVDGQIDGVGQVVGCRGRSDLFCAGFICHQHLV